VNCTYYEALGCDDRAMLIARLVQLFLPGIPQVYYVGLLAGRNDVELLRATGVGRDINRARVTRGDLDAALARPVVRRQLAAIRLRSEHPAFGGAFSSHCEGTALRLTWRNGSDVLELRVDFETRELRLTEDGAEVALG
jgi:sucrose phosphorylase